RQRGGRATATPRRFDVPAEPDRLRAVDAIQALLERTLLETQTLANGEGRSRAIFAGLRLALDALEVGELEARLTALESRLGAGGPRGAGRQLSISR
nr:hypothetical protein [Gemmatimonadales bacterium]